MKPSLPRGDGLMIAVVRGAEVTGGPDRPSRFHYHVAGHEISGLSRQPLSDACRKLIAQGFDPLTPVGRFREGRTEPDLISTVGAAAALTVIDPDRGTIHFAKFKPFEPEDRARKFKEAVTKGSSGSAHALSEPEAH